MFRKRTSGGILPSAAVSSGPAYKPTRKPMSWPTVSLLLIYAGVRFVRTPTDSRLVTCEGRGDEAACVLIFSTEDENFEIKGAVLGAEMVRTRRGRVVNTKGMRPRSTRKLGQSYTLSFRRLPEQGAGDGGESKKEEFLMSSNSLGRREVRKKVNAITTYLKGAGSKSAPKKLKVKQSSGVSAIGILLIVYGAFSLLFCVVVGQFSEPPPDRPPPRRRPPAHKRHD